jgi:hypothetical protein
MHDNDRSWHKPAFSKRTLCRNFNAVRGLNKCVKGYTSAACHFLHLCPHGGACAVAGCLLDHPAADVLERALVKVAPRGAHESAPPPARASTSARLAVAYETPRPARAREEPTAAWQAPPPACIAAPEAAPAPADAPDDEFDYAVRALLAAAESGLDTERLLAALPRDLRPPPGRASSWLGALDGVRAEHYSASTLYFLL